MDVPESDKKMANTTVMHFERLVKRINNLNKQLNYIYIPFKTYKTVSPESINKYRGAIWNYLKEIKDNFKEIKDLATLCLRGLNHFSSDTHTSELINVFSDDFGNIEDQLISLNTVLTTWDHPAYKDNVIKNIESLKKQGAELKKLIYDRVIEHINTNILNKNWVDEVNDQLSTTVKSNEPLISRLYNERKQKI